MSQNSHLIPPHNEEAEEACLGALLLDFSVIMLDSVRELIQHNDFYKGAHQIIFSGIIDLHESGGEVDLSTLNDWFSAQDNLDRIGGSDYLSYLMSKVNASVSASHYASIIKKLSLRRSLIASLKKSVEQSYDQTKSVRQIVEDVEQSLFELFMDKNRNDLRMASEIVQKTVSGISKRRNNKEGKRGISSGIDGLDCFTGGFQMSEMIIVGARPSMGKTALALSMAVNIAIRTQIPCGYFSLEMSAESLMLKILAGEARINSSDLKSGLISRSSDYSRLAEAASHIYDSKLLIQDTPNIGIADLRSFTRRMVTQHDVKIIFIDYLGLISSNKSQLLKCDQMSLISCSLKGLARELEIPIILLTQVGHSSKDRIPALSELKDLGSLEQDADLILFLHRGKVAEKMQEAELVVAKNRNGPTGKVSLAFLPEFTRFQNLD